MVSSTDSSSSGDDESGEQTVSEEEVESPVDEEQQHDEEEQQSVESPVDDEPQQSVPKPKPVRGPRKPKTASKWPIDVIEVKGIHPDGKPIEVEEVRRLRLLARLIARQQLSLVMPSFNNLKTEDKWILFDKHVMPYLKFPDTMKTEGFKYMMKVISKSWRTHKNRLVTDFIEKDLSPFKQHPYIDPEDWEEFEALKKSPEEAILQRIQWRRDWILVKHTHETQRTQSQPDETTKSAKSASKGNNAIISTQLLRGANSAPSNHQSPATSDATKSVPKENVAANPSKNPKSSEECTKQPTQQKVGSEAVRSSAKPPKQQKGASKAAGESGKAATNRKWLEKYKCGHPFLPSMDLKALGPSYAALHDHYMKDCVNYEHGIKVRFRGIYMLTSSDFELGLVRYNFLYDFFHYGALDSSLLQCWTLSLVVETKAKHIPVGFLDPQMMSLNSIKFDRDKVVQYVQKAFTKFTKDDYIIFAHNSGGSAGGHWIVVIVIQKWDKVIYLDSDKSGNHDFSMLKLLIDEAFARHTSTLKDRPNPLKHKFKYACHQQTSVKSSGWYAAHHLSVAMRKTNLECSEEFEVLTKPIDMRVIREQLAKFLVEQVINKKEEFHHHQ